MSIVIKELFGSDSISDLVRKINENFDQLLINGGGPEGPVGPVGQQGVAGPEGIRGSQWFGVTSVGGTGATGETTINQPTDGVFRDNDFSLDGDGNVDYYDNGIWLPTDINLKGSKGDKGIEGDGTISVLRGENSGMSDPITGETRFQPNWNELKDYLQRIEDLYNADPNSSDSDDYYGVFTPDRVEGGLDFITLGRGNNSLVLGRYASLFYNSGTVPNGATSYFNPPQDSGGVVNPTIKSFPTTVEDVPMLIVAQNDYKGNKDEIDAKYVNGISIGLMKSQPTSVYAASPSDPFNNDFDYITFSNISIENRFSDLKIKSFGKLTLTNTQGESLFRLGTNLQGRSDTTDVHDISTLLYSNVYTEFELKDSITIDNYETFDKPGFIFGQPSTYTGVINRTHFNLHENRSGIWNTDADSRNNIGRSFITQGSNGPANAGLASELLFMSSPLLEDDAGSNEKIGKKVLQDGISGMILDSNHKNNPMTLGKTVVDARKNIGDTIDTDPSYINLGYLGLGYDQTFVHYSGIDTTNFAGTNSLNNGSPNTSLDGVLPNDDDLENFLGYDIKDPINDNNQSRSVSRIGVYPGIFRQEKIDATNFDPADSPIRFRREKFFDLSHKMLPTGSMDLFGTIRLREQETTNDGAKDGQIAVNKKDGIVGWEKIQNVLWYHVNLQTDSVDTEWLYLFGLDVDFTLPEIVDSVYKLEIFQEDNTERIGYVKFRLFSSDTININPEIKVNILEANGFFDFENVKIESGTRLDGSSYVILKGLEVDSSYRVSLNNEYHLGFEIPTKLFLDTDTGNFSDDNITYHWKRNESSVLVNLDDGRSLNGSTYIYTAAIKESVSMTGEYISSLTNTVANNYYKILKLKENINFYEIYSPQPTNIDKIRRNILVGINSDGFNNLYPGYTITLKFNIGVSDENAITGFRDDGKTAQSEVRRFYVASRDNAMNGYGRIDEINYLTGFIRGTSEISQPYIDTALTPFQFLLRMRKEQFNLSNNVVGGNTVKYQPISLTANSILPSEFASTSFDYGIIPHTTTYDYSAYQSVTYYTVVWDGESWSITNESVHFAQNP